jgi:hypothetical protein
MTNYEDGTGKEVAMAYFSQGIRCHGRDTSRKIPKFCFTAELIGWTEGFYNFRPMSRTEIFLSLSVCFIPRVALAILTCGKEHFNLEEMLSKLVLALVFILSLWMSPVQISAETLTILIDFSWFFLRKF